MAISRKITAHPYPLNLLRALCPGSSEKEPPPNLLASVELQLGTLTERERQALHLRYREGMTLSEVGNELGLSGVYAGEVIARGIRKLRHPSRLRHIGMGDTEQETAEEWIK